MGSVPPKRHTQHRPDGTNLAYEELMGEEGFSSDSSLLYHRNLPSRIVGSEEWTLPDLTTRPNHPLKPLHLKLHDLFDVDQIADVDVVRGRRLVLGNGDVRISYVVAGATSPLYRNGIGDECCYVERGQRARRDDLRRVRGRPGRLRDPAARDHSPVDPVRRG